MLESRLGILVVGDLVEKGRLTETARSGKNLPDSEKQFPDNYRKDKDK